MRKPYTLVRRTLKSGRQVWYFRLGADKKRSLRSTGEIRKYRAEIYVEDLLKKMEIPPATLRDYIVPYFIWETCPHATRLQDEGKNISRRYVHNRRLLIDKHILNDPMADQVMAEVKRSDLIQFRSRLLKHLGPSTVN